MPLGSVGSGKDPEGNDGSKASSGSHYSSSETRANTQTNLLCTQHKWSEDRQRNHVPSFTDIQDAYDVGSESMKVKVQLFVGGKVFYEIVEARNYQDARQTALARNPTAKLVSTTAIMK